jgi:hypothetical protein
LNNLLAEAKSNLESNMMPFISHILEETEQAQNMWPAIRKMHDVCVQNAEGELRPKLAALALNDDEQFKRHLETLRAHGPVVVKKCVKDTAQHLSLMMEKRFDELFNFDENKLPRRWKRRDNIPSLFTDARQQSEALVDIFSFVRLSSSEDTMEIKPIDDDPRTILSSKERNSLSERFRATTNAAYKTAIQEQEAAKAAGMNPLYLILLLVLGWNELLYILSWIIGPLLVPVLLIFGIAGYVVYAKVGGPAAQVIETVVISAAKQAVTYATNLFQQYTSSPNQRVPVAVPNHKKSD